MLDGSQLLGVAAIITAVGTVYAQVRATIEGPRARKRIESKIEQVHNEVKTGNGITMAALADRTEGRRIQADIPEEHRTEGEQGYVDGLHAGGRNPGHGGEPRLEEDTQP